ncbi:hypothetical protein TRFO_19290 [Tritrichomonas foetus]|uniref:USP domain-containing protein n=1 Tax=Tritrichomonas foetus TaxID=1144522 RepID=A0A1J4KPG5_9EUKA|nr:hypothetical protein TRFO_19290 [Tritrichomonas foetus]|eukprot:OHT11309.1 hypothetical protein TRFO_19290 [Tritrichomonas foetus]
MFDFFGDFPSFAPPATPPPLAFNSNSNCISARWTIENYQTTAPKRFSIQFDSTTYQFRFQQPQPQYLTISIESREKSIINQVFFIELILHSQDPLKTITIYSPFLLKSSDQQSIIETLIPSSDLEFYSWDGNLVIDIRFSDAQFESIGLPLLSPNSIPKILKPLKYAGIFNQGSTCYMNSILQSLFHLPVFRNNIYITQSPGRITTELQRLFGFLQSSNKPVSTRGLTQAFGWNDARTFQQHDAQEFYNKLIDMVIEESPIKQNYKTLFYGKWCKLIQCKNINYSTQNYEDFDDLQMQVRGCLDLYTSFKQFTEPQILEGNNQYMTPMGKQDAFVKTYFVSLPPILNIHLQRFIYNSKTRNKEKVNDRFEFPSNLDLTAFSATPNAQYTLCSVLVHCGSTTNGHYLAYIKPTPEESWYEFNDSNVTQCSEKNAVSDNYGGTSSSAYMLVYVQNIKLFEIFSEVSIPTHVSELLKNAIPFKTQAPKEIPCRSISLFTEDCYRQMVLMGADNYDFINFPPKIEIPEKSTIYDLYNDVSTFLDRPVDGILIWKVSTLYMPTLLLPNGPGKIPKDDTYFIQFVTDYMKPMISLINSKKNIIVVFLKFFFSRATPQVQFLGSTLANVYQPVSQLLPVIYGILGGTNDLPVNVYYDGLGFSKKITDIEQSLLYYQINDSSSILFEPYDQSFMPTSFKIESCTQHHICINYYSMLRPYGDKNAEEYLERQKCQLAIDFCQVTEPNTVVVTCVAPETMIVTELPQLILFALNEQQHSNINLNTNATTNTVVQVFRRQTNSDLPEIMPYHLRNDITLKNLFVSEFRKVSAYKSLRLFFDVIQGYTEKQLKMMVFRVIDVYDSLIHFVKRIRIPMRLDEDISCILQHVNQLNVLDGHIRVLLNINDEILKVPDQSDYFDESTVFRVEKIPQDQIYLGSNSFLLTTSVYKSNKKIDMKTPIHMFLLRIVMGENLTHIKIRLGEIEFASKEIIENSLFFINSKQLNDNTIISYEANQNSTLKVFLGSEKKSTTKNKKEPKPKQKNEFFPEFEDSLKFFM